MPTIEQIRAVARKHFDPKKQCVACNELVRDIAALFGMKVDDEPFTLSAERETGPLIPKRLDDPRFIVMWNQWIAMRKKKKYSTSTETLNEHLRLLDECDLPNAYDCLRTATYAEHRTIYNQRYKRNGGTNSGRSMAGSVEEAAKRSRDGVL